VIAFLPPGTFTQLSFAFVVVFGFFVLHNEYRAYESDDDNLYLWAACVAILLSLFSAIMLKANELSEELGLPVTAAETVGAELLFVGSNVVVALMFVYLCIKDDRAVSYIEGAPPIQVGGPNPDPTNPNPTCKSNPNPNLYPDPNPILHIQVGGAIAKVLQVPGSTSSPAYSRFFVGGLRKVPPLHRWDT